MTIKYSILGACIWDACAWYYDLLVDWLRDRSSKSKFASGHMNTTEKSLIPWSLSFAIWKIRSTITKFFFILNSPILDYDFCLNFKFKFHLINHSYCHFLLSVHTKQVHWILLCQEVSWIISSYKILSRPDNLFMVVVTTHWRNRLSGGRNLLQILL